LALKNITRNFWLGAFTLFTSVACAAIGYFLLTRIDLIVHGELYYFGLVFSTEWADPYRTYMLLIYVCLVLPVVLSGLSLFFSYKAKETLKELRSPSKIKKEVVQEIPQTVKPQPIIREELKEIAQEIPQTVKPQPIIREELSTLGDNANMATSCPKCGKVFAAPIVTIDFSGGKPKLVDACPYCSSVLEQRLQQKQSAKVNS
jgi:hypothetical protein